MLDEKQEIWKPINNYEGCYEASNMGRIRSVERLVKCKNGTRTSPSTILKPSLGQWGYEQVTLRKEGKKETVRINRIIAQTFIPNPNKLPQVNHIDGNKENNNVSNLEWVTAKENTNHAFETGLHSNTRAVRVIETGEIFSTIEKFKKAYGCKSGSAPQDSLKRGRKVKGVHLEYV